MESNIATERKKVFYLEKSAFLRKLLELGLKDRGIEYFTLDQVSEAKLFLPEIGLSLAIIDEETANGELQSLKDICEAAQIPVWITARHGEGKILRPINVSELFKKISEHIS